MAKLGSRLVYYLYLGATGLIRALPLPLVFRLGVLVGKIGFVLAPKYRNLARRNAEIAFGKERAKEIAHTSFERLGANFFSAVKLAGANAEEIKSVLVGSDGVEMRDALREGNGLIILVAHLGNWELLAQFSSMVPDIPVSVVYQKMRNPLVDKAFRTMRESKGMRLVERKDGIGSLVSTLRAGGLVAVLADQHAGNGGIWSPFFGKIASSSPLAAMLALRTGSPVMTAAALTDGIARWRFSLGAPHYLKGKGNDIAETTAQVNQIVESMIRESPSDWFWVHNRWKTPHPRFLLERYKRGLSEAAEPAKLQPFRLAVRSSNWLGDCVMTLPALAAIRNGRPDLHLTMICREKLADFWKRVKLVDSVVVLPNKSSLFDSSKRIKAGGPFEAIVLFPNSPRVAFEAWLAGIPRRAGAPGRWRKRLLNQVIVEKNRPLRPRHQAWDYLAIAEAIGAQKPEALSVGGLLQPTAHSTESRNGFRIGVCAGAEYGPAKRWLPERFAEVIRTISERRACEWILFGVRKDADAAEAILGKCANGVSNRVGKTSLGELIDELGSCDILLSNDSGPMHLAAALGIPCVALFGSTEPVLTGPIGEIHRVLRHQVECSPCFLRDCPIDFRCMRAIEVSEVVEAILRVMEIPKSSAGD